MSSSRELRFIVTDGLDLSSRGALRVKAVSNPFRSELLRQLDTNNPLTEAKHLSVVAQDRPLDGEGVVSSDRTDAGNLVCGDGDTQACPTDEETAVRFAFANEFGAGDGGVWVGGFVGGGIDADVDDGGDEGVLFEGGLEGFLVGLASFIAGEDDAEGLEVGHFV
jgi:hypothetical protein